MGFGWVFLQPSYWPNGIYFLKSKNGPLITWASGKQDEEATEPKSSHLFDLNLCSKWAKAGCGNWFKSIYTVCPVFCCPQNLNKKKNPMPLAMQMPLAEAQLVRGQWQQDVHKTPDERQAPQNRGLPPGKLGLASSEAHSICLVCHHQLQPPVTR